jgi:maspardin
MKKYILLLILISIIVFYFLPVEQFEFEELYTNDDDVRFSLNEFRKEPTKLITFKGQSVEYYSSGVGDTAMLFLHGMGGSYDIWWQQINHFKGKNRMISFTYPEVKTLKDLSECVILILENEKIKKVNLIGSSLGGYLAQYFAENYPDHVLKMSLGNTFPPNDEHKDKNASLIFIMKLLPEWLVIKMIRKKYNDEVVPAAENSLLVKAFLNELLGTKVSKKSFTSRYHCVVDTFILKRSLYLPVQIIESDNDPLVSEVLRNQLKQSYPNALTITLNGKGHFPYLNDAERYNQVLNDFLK